MGESAVKLELGSDGRSRVGVGARSVEGGRVQRQQRASQKNCKRSRRICRRKEVFDFRPFNTTRFEITRGKDTRAFERVKGTGENAVDTWKQVAPSAEDRRRQQPRRRPARFLEPSRGEFRRAIAGRRPAMRTRRCHLGEIRRRKEGRARLLRHGRRQRVCGARRSARRAEARGGQVRRGGQEARRHSVR